MDSKLWVLAVYFISAVSIIARARPSTNSHQMIDRNAAATLKEARRHPEANAGLAESVSKTKKLLRKEFDREAEVINATLHFGTSYQDLFRIVMKSWKGCNESLQHQTTALFKDYFYNAQWGSQARSGAGSTMPAAQPFAEFLLKFMKRNSVKSITEVSCGHWPSGWQSHITWPKIDYHGVDIVRDIVEANNALLANQSDKFGLEYAEFHPGDMACDVLPSSDLLLVKDTLQHLSFDYINAFLAKNVFGAAAKRHKFVMFVNDMLLGVEENFDIKNGEQRHLEMSGYPFFLKVTPAFAWRALDMKKIVEVYALGKAAKLDDSDVATVSTVREAVYEWTN